MSYEIVKSINEKQHKLIYATNNLRPLTFEPWIMKNKDGSPVSDDEFRAFVVRNIIEGNFHAPKNHKYTLIANAITNTAEYADFDEKLWNWNDTYTQEYMKTYYKQNLKEFEDFISRIFPIAEKAIKSKMQELQALPGYAEIEIPRVKYVPYGEKRLPEIHYEKFTKMNKYDNPKRQIWWGDSIKWNVSQNYLATQAVKEEIIDEYYKQYPQAIRPAELNKNTPAKKHM